MTHTVVKEKRFSEIFIKEVIPPAVMSKKPNKKNQEKLKIYLAKNDAESNNNTNKKLRVKSSTN